MSKHLLFALMTITGTSNLPAQSTTFNYQGRLDNGGSPANGLYDLEFTVFDVESGGTAIAGPVTNNGITISNGLFVTTLDFGPGVFSGAARWVEVAVRTNTGSSFTTLSPRTAFTPTPYAMHAFNVNSSGIAGTYGQAVDFINPANTFTGTFTGDGSSLTNVDAASLGGLSAANFWQLGGNSGTTAGVNFVGTTDNQPLILKANGQQALRLESASETPNVIGGAEANSVSNTIKGATIAGGGLPIYPNMITADFAAIGGGTFHIAGGAWATIAGGRDNRAYGESSTVAGGYANFIDTNAFVGAIGGGFINWLAASAGAATIAGGWGNRVETNAWYAAIGGGLFNTNQANSSYATLAGGWRNQVGPGVLAGTVGGGENNRTLANHATVAGGLNNTNTGPGATIGGGNANSTVANDTVVAGGIRNQILLNSFQSAIGGGGDNSVGSNSWYSTIAGGRDNHVLADASLGTIAGGEANIIGNHSWRSSIGAGYQNTIADESQGARIDGGFSNRINTNSDYATIGGGTGNLVETNAFSAVVAGGEGNQVTGQHSTVSGGILNENTGLGATIGGGNRNVTAANDTAIAGGTHNSIAADSRQSNIGGGGYNSIGSNSPNATVAGGDQNMLLSNATNAVIGGGRLNIVGTNNSYGTIGGGLSNRLGNLATFSTIAGGTENRAENAYSFAGGGLRSLALGFASVVAGGVENAATASFAATPGGAGNLAGGNYSFAAGRRAKVIHQGTFLWTDSTDADFYSTANNQFLVRAGGGVGINTASPTAALHVGGTPGADGIRFPDGTLQTTAASPPPAPPVPQIYFNSGSGSAPAATNNFLTSPLAVVITNANQKIVVTAHKAMGSTSVAGATGLALYIGYRLSGSVAEPSLAGNGVLGNRVPQNTRVTLGLSGMVTGLAPGTYQVGLVGNSSDAANWNSNEWGYTTAVVY